MNGINLITKLALSLLIPSFGVQVDAKRRKSYNQAMNQDMIQEVIRTYRMQKGV